VSRHRGAEQSGIRGGRAMKNEEKTMQNFSGSTPEVSYGAGKR